MAAVRTFLPLKNLFNARDSMEYIKLTPTTPPISYTLTAIL